MSEVALYCWKMGFVLGGTKKSMFADTRARQRKTKKRRAQKEREGEEEEESEKEKEKEKEKHADMLLARTDLRP